MQLKLVVCCILSVLPCMRILFSYSFFLGNAGQIAALSRSDQDSLVRPKGVDKLKPLQSELFTLCWGWQWLEKKFVEIRSGGFGISKFRYNTESITDIYLTYLFRAVFLIRICWIESLLISIMRTSSEQYNRQSSGTILSRYWSWYRNSDILIFNICKNLYRYFKIFSNCKYTKDLD